MSEIEVRIVKLEQMRMLSSYGFGPNPESIAWDKLTTFCLDKGLFEKDNYRPTYGFNNPNPSVGSPNYGYELWIEVGEEVEAEGDVRIQGFPGGVYAVTRCEVFGGNFENITQTWHKLAAWREDSQYHLGSHQLLEKTIPVQGHPEGDFILDLYLPITD